MHDPVAIPKVEVNTERFNTVNLQAEIAKGMQQIMDATEKETVTDTLDNINRMVEDVPYLKNADGGRKARGTAGTEYTAH